MHRIESLRFPRLLVNIIQGDLVSVCFADFGIANCSNTRAISLESKLIEILFAFLS